MRNVLLLAIPPSSDAVSYPTNCVLAHYGAIAMVWLVGAMALHSEAQGLSHSARTVALHVFFALLLYACVLARRMLWSEVLSRVPGRIRKEFDRLTARSVYLLLYALVGYQLLIGLGDRTQLHMERCQFFVVCGIVALYLIRVGAGSPLEPPTVEH